MVTFRNSKRQVGHLLKANSFFRNVNSAVGGTDMCMRVLTASLQTLRGCITLHVTAYDGGGRT